MSATTRPQRPGEQDGVHYWFLDREEFDRRVVAGEFLEWVDYVGNRYGTLNSEIDRLRDAGQAPLLELETDGALRVKRRVRGAVTIFVTAPVEELERRLRERATESSGVIDERLATARRQLELQDEFDYVVENDDRERAADDARGDRRPEARRCRYHGATMIHPRIDDLLEQGRLPVRARDRRRQARAPDQQLPPPAW